MTVLGLNEPEQIERRGEPMMNGDRRAGPGWKAVIDNKVAAPLIVVAVLASLAWLSGVSSLPAAVKFQGEQLASTANRVDLLERNEIRKEEQMRYLVKLVEGLAESDRKRNERGR